MHLGLSIKTVGEEKDVKFYHGLRIYPFQLLIGQNWGKNKTKGACSWDIIFK
jgi:hypothetical protein